MASLKDLWRKTMQRAPAPQQERHALVGPAKLWRMKRKFQEDFLLEHGLTPGHTLVDIGCGTLRGGLPLIEFLETGHYCGIEVRAEVLDEGRKELAEAGLENKEPRLIACPDISTLDLDAEFDFAWAFSVLIHMTDEIVDDTLRFVARHLAPHGVFYANVNVGEHTTGSWQGFPVVHRSWDSIERSAKECGLAVEDLGTLGSLGHVSSNAAADAQHMLLFWADGT